jgi:hypothetical protein
MKRIFGMKCIAVNKEFENYKRREITFDFIVLINVGRRLKSLNN